MFNIVSSMSSCLRPVLTKLIYPCMTILLNRVGCSWVFTGFYNCDDDVCMMASFKNDYFHCIDNFLHFCEQLINIFMVYNAKKVLAIMTLLFFCNILSSSFHINRSVLLKWCSLIRHEILYQNLSCTSISCSCHLIYTNMKIILTYSCQY